VNKKIHHRRFYDGSVMDLDSDSIIFYLLIWPFALHSLY